MKKELLALRMQVLQLSEQNRVLAEQFEASSAGQGEAAGVGIRHVKSTAILQLALRAAETEKVAALRTAGKYQHPPPPLSVDLELESWWT